MDRLYKLVDGSNILESYGTFKPNLLFHTTLPYHNVIHMLKELSINYEERKRIIKEFNIIHEGVVFSIVKGRLSRTKNGADMFSLYDKSTHYLISIRWNYPFASKGVDTMRTKNLAYYRTTSDENEMNGYDYVIVPKDYKNVLTLEDF